MHEVSGERRGELPVKGWDIHCPMFPGAESKKNYLKLSCRVRQATESCTVKECPHRYEATSAQGQAPHAHTPSAKPRSDQHSHLQVAQAHQKQQESLPGALVGAMTVVLRFSEVDKYILDALKEEAEKAGADVAEDIKSILDLFVCGELVIKEG